MTCLCGGYPYGSGLRDHINDGDCVRALAGRIFLLEQRLGNLGGA